MSGQWVFEQAHVRRSTMAPAICLHPLTMDACHWIRAWSCGTALCPAVVETIPLLFQLYVYTSPTLKIEACRLFLSFLMTTASKVGSSLKGAADRLGNNTIQFPIL